MDLKAYLERIGLLGITLETFTPTLQALCELHFHHLLSIPFESLSIHIGEKVILDIHWIFQKIVQRRRGGFCYEQNGLFCWVLRELGYRPRLLSARVRNQESGVFGPPCDHMIIMVELEGRRWLCDVGFGDGMAVPLPLEAGRREERQVNGVFQLQAEEEEWYLNRKEGGLWKVLYKFTLEERVWEDFLEMCEYHQTSQRSMFVRKSFCSRQLPRGRVTYMGLRLITTEYTEDGESVRTTRDLTQEEIPPLLRDSFGIVLEETFIPKDVVASSAMDLKAYLERIGLPGIRLETFTPTLQALCELHFHHLLSVPFESLSIHIGEKVILDIHWIFQKIVQRRRGGFCYEQNGLFCWVLRELGYRPRLLSARVRSKENGLYGPSYDHMIIVVELKGRKYLCDVGYGDAMAAPLPLEAGWEERQVNGVFQVQAQKDRWYLKRKEGDVWRALYKFKLEEQTWQDFQEMCEFHQTSPLSLFVCKSFCSLQLPQGRLTYVGLRVITTHYTEDGENVRTTQFLSPELIPQLLRERFGIVLEEKFVPRDDCQIDDSDDGL
ncbi:uncharacterized protein PAF06_019457 [Gastrophryne carolinensis]